MSKKQSKKYTKKQKKGGEALGAGSYGCVFRPTLKCKNSSKKFSGVSKLLVIEEARKEMIIIENVMPIIKKIPNNKKYFIPNSEELFINCPVGELTQKDLKNSEKCTNFNQQSYLTPGWINTNKNKLSIIQQSDGGEDFFKVITNLNLENFINEFSIITNKMIELIEYGIKPMHEKGLIHLDMKPPNLVYKVEKSDSFLRIIDWGFAIPTNNLPFNKILDTMISWTMMYNVPFSSILFDNKLIQYMNELIRGGMSNEKIAEVIYNKISKIPEPDGGHHEHIKKDINILYKSDENIQNLFINYIKTILNKYKINNKFNAEKYFNEVYKENADIYGLLTTYIDIIKYIDIDKDISRKIKLFIKKYLYSNEFATTAYNIKELCDDMRDIISQGSPKPVINKGESPKPLANKEGSPNSSIYFTAESLSQKTPPMLSSPPLRERMKALYISDDKIDVFLKKLNKSGGKKTKKHKQKKHKKTNKKQKQTKKQKNKNTKKNIKKQLKKFIFK